MNKQYWVEINGRKRRFVTLPEAEAFAENYRRLTGHILGIQKDGGR